MSYISTTIESLELQIQSNSTSATNGIDALSASLSKLKNAIKGGVGLTSVANQIHNLDTALKSLDDSSISKIDKLANSLSKLSTLGKVKISSSIASQLRNIGGATAALGTADFSSLDRLGRALSPLTVIGKASGLRSVIIQLGKLSELARTLDSINWNQFTSQLRMLSDALRPLTNQLNTVSNAFGRLPANLRRTINATNSLSASNNRASSSYADLWAKSRMAMNVVRGSARAIAGWIAESNNYVENLNLFTASMGDYASEAKRYAEQVGEVMGIDPGEFMRNQGVFMTITEGFGVASERAHIMSKNLTQLGYDLSSFFNISFADSMQKLTSGISGELEPLRRLGYDLSQARLKAVAFSLGIKKSFNDMTQAEKAQLRYYAIMTQVTKAQGDMARTLNAPANQLRILKAQLVQVGRALGNVFIPVLNTVLPYAIALAKVIRIIADSIANLVGFKLPEIDYSGLKAGGSAIGNLAANADKASAGLGKAGKKAKKLKDALLGIDELNIISEDKMNALDGLGEGLGGLGEGLGGGDLGFELPEYDFLSGAINTKVDEIINKFKEWAGLTDEIDTWAEFFRTKLGRILILVGEIAAGLLAWKFTKSFLEGLAWLQGLRKLGLTTPLTIASGIVLTITGLTIEWTGLLSIIRDGIDKLNLGETIGGGILTTIGGSFIGKAASSLLAKAGITSAAVEAGMGVSLAGALFGGGIAAVVAGLPAFVVGVYSLIKEGLSGLSVFLTEFGATLTGAGAGAIGAALGAWAGPIGIAVGALIGVVVGALTNLGIYLYQNWEDVKQWVTNLGNTIKTFFTKTLPNFFKNLPKKIKNGWENAIRPIKDFDWKHFGYTLGKKTGTFVKKICEALKKFFTQTLPSVWEKIKKEFGDFFSKTLPEFFTKKIPEFFNTVKEEFITFFTETLPEALSTIGTWFIDVGIAIWDGIVEGFNTAIKAIADFIDGFVQGFKDALGIHSSSTVFRDEVGKFIGEGLKEGILLPFKKIGQWVKDNLISPIQKIISENPIKQGVNLVKSGWQSVKSWLGNIPTVSQAVNLVKSGWQSVKNWIGHIPTLSQTISLFKKGWSTVKGWIGNIPTLSQAISLIKSGWTTIKNWVGHIPILSQGISLLKSGWTTVKAWIGNLPIISQGISLIKSGWNTVKSWIGDHIVPTGISLFKSGWTSLSSWIGDKVSVGISLFKDGWNSIKGFFGLSTGGYNTGHGFKMFAKGGFIGANGKSGFWKSVPMYANGTANAGLHGSLFVAGESGAEMVGHINGQTEVLNQSQIKLAMRSAVVSGMAQFIGYWRAIHGQIAIGANAVIRSILVNTDVLNAAIMSNSHYDLSNILAQSVYDDSQKDFNHLISDESMARALREFYREYVEPTLKEIALDVKRQANKEEQTIVQIGNKTITDAVVTQKRANGFIFAE